MLNVKKKHLKVKNNGHIQKKMVYVVVHQIRDELNRWCTVYTEIKYQPIHQYTDVYKQKVNQMIWRIAICIICIELDYLSPSTVLLPFLQKTSKKY